MTTSNATRSLDYKQSVVNDHTRRTDRYRATVGKLLYTTVSVHTPALLPLLKPQT